MNYIFATVFVGIAGWIVGRMQRDQFMADQNSSQQERGDYWFDRYQEVIKQHA